MMTRRAMTAVAMLAGALSLRADLQKAMAEPNLEKRSKLALDNAESAYQSARKAYEKGDNDAVSTAAAEIVDSLAVAQKSLKDTGKDPRRSPKWFKRAEIETRDLQRRLEGFQLEMGFSDRPLLEKAKAKVQEVHDELLLGLMEGKKK